MGISSLCRRAVAKVCFAFAVIASVAGTNCLAANPTTPTSDFQDNGDGTVTHRLTGLVWKRCAEGQEWSQNTCSGQASLFTPKAAIAHAPLVSFANHSDWRLPSIRELLTIVERESFNPAINSLIFPNSQASEFWSSTEGAEKDSGTWAVGFYAGGAGAYGGANAPSQPAYYARLVRGQPVSRWALNRDISDYVDQGDGTVIHTTSGLGWKRCAEGQSWDGLGCSGQAGVFSWESAGSLLTATPNPDGWRLPTMNELLSLIDFTLPEPAINRTIFPDTPTYHFYPVGFWSTSTTAFKEDTAWAVYFSSGWAYPYAKTNQFFVRFVRDVPTEQKPTGCSPDCTVQLVSGWNLIGNSSLSSIAASTVFGDSEKISSVWKWVIKGIGPGVSYPTWAFYSPTESDGGQAYAASKGYEHLTTIKAGEGFWVHAKTSVGVNLPSTGAVASGAFKDLSSGWHLIATGDHKSPAEFQVEVPVTTLWAWDSTQSKWYFYSPSLQAQGATALSDYNKAQGYLDFSSSGKFLGTGIGLWINRP